MCADNDFASQSNHDSLENDVLHLLTQGGMMQITYAYLFGQELYLLTPPTKAQPHCCYNYFDETFHDDAVFYPADQTLCYGPLGNGNFAHVIQATNRLIALRKHISQDPLIPFNFDSLFSKIDGWLSYSFDDIITFSPNPWLFYQAAFPNERKEDLVKTIWKRKETQKFILEECFGPYISQDKQLLEKKYGIRFPQCMPESILRNAEESINCIRLSDTSLKEKFDFLREALYGRRSDAFGMPPCYEMFLIARDTLPVEILLPMIEKEFNLGKESLQREFDAASFHFPAFSLYQNRYLNRTVTTAEFLHISDDDRAYYWSHDGDVSFSIEMQTWLCSLKEKYQTILRSAEAPLSAVNFTLLLFNTLEYINKEFREIYAYSDMLTDFLSHPNSPEYQAALAILYRLAQCTENFTAYHGPWDLAPVDFKKQPPRLAVKRYLAVLANRKLRYKIFGF